MTENGKSFASFLPLPPRPAPPNNMLLDLSWQKVISSPSTTAFVVSKGSISSLLTQVEIRNIFKSIYFKNFIKLYTERYAYYLFNLCFYYDKNNMDSALNKFLSL